MCVFDSSDGAHSMQGCNEWYIPTMEPSMSQETKLNKAYDAINISKAAHTSLRAQRGRREATEPTISLHVVVALHPRGGRIIPLNIGFELHSARFIESMDST